MKFDENDLQDILIKVLPEDLNPDDIANSAMALDCITTVSEDFFREMTGLEWLFQWKDDFH